MSAVEDVAEALSKVPVRDSIDPGGQLDQLRLREAARAAIAAWQKSCQPWASDIARQGYAIWRGSSRAPSFVPASWEDLTEEQRAVYVAVAAYALAQMT